MSTPVSQSDSAGPDDRQSAVQDDLSGTQDRQQGFKENSLPFLGKLFVKIFGSYGTVVVILLLLTLLTFFGTHEQKHLNIYDVQDKYFNSAFVVVAEIGPIPIILPGAYLLLAFLAVALVVGGLIRVRWTKSRAGVLITHIGMLVMLAGGLIEYNFSTKGYMSLVEEEEYEDLNGNGQFDPGDERFRDHNGDGQWTAGQRKDYFTSHFLRDVVLVRRTRSGAVREYMLRYETLAKSNERPITFQHADWPFDLVASGFQRNSAPVPVAPGAGYGVKGFALRGLPPDAEKAERHLPGLYATFRSKGGTEPAVREIVWAAQRYPPAVFRDGHLWELDMRPRQFPLPFTVQLHSVKGVKHPGTRRAKEYSSRVSKIENDIVERKHIMMNEPLRHGGFILYQSGFDDSQVPEISTFAVNQNPADRLPLISCIIIGLGLLLHFVMKLRRHIASQRRQASTRKKVAA